MRSMKKIIQQHFPQALNYLKPIQELGELSKKSTEPCNISGREFTRQSSRVLLIGDFWGFYASSFDFKNIFNVGQLFISQQTRSCKCKPWRKDYCWRQYILMTAKNDKETKNCVCGWGVTQPDTVTPNTQEPGGT